MVVFFFRFYHDGEIDSDCAPYRAWASHHEERLTCETISPSPAGTVDHELGRSGDTYTDATLDTEQSTTEDFAAIPQTDRAYTESPVPSGFRFERTGPFYKSTRFKEINDYEGSVPVSPAMDHIPENFFVTVSGIDETRPKASRDDMVCVTTALATKPRNVTEV